VLDDLYAALVSDEHPRALVLAIEAWRESRAPELADLVDAIAARCPGPIPPHSKWKIPGWWMSHAAGYEPTAVASLLEQLWVRSAERLGDPRVVAHRGPNPIIDILVMLGDGALPSYAEHWVDRLATLVTWPDDPRLAPVFCDFLLRELVMARVGLVAIEDLLVDRLVSLGDLRVIDRLAAYIAEPRGNSEDQRVQHTASARRAITALEPLRRTTAPELRVRIAACAALLASQVPLPAPVDLDALWQEVAEHPEDLAPRLVLADALVEQGDSRGELIALQCTRDGLDEQARRRAETRERELLRRDWKRWLGDLALIVVRKGSELRRGTFEVLRVGHQATPPWAWAKVRGHRELLTVHGVLPNHVEPAHFAELVDGIAAPRMIGVDAPEVIDELRARRVRLPLTRLIFDRSNSTTPHRRAWPPLAETFTGIAALSPDLEVIEFPPFWYGGFEVRDLVPLLPAMFARLRVIRVHSLTLSRISDDPGALERVRALPLVEIC
jgi:uncharacterized protein (TIGR02996 family)